jgi:hypothetical protein
MSSIHSSLVAPAAARRPYWPAVLMTSLTCTVAETRAQSISIGSSVGTTPDIPPVFRLGSGAVLGEGPLHDPAANIYLGLGTGGKRQLRTVALFI